MVFSNVLSKKRFVILVVIFFSTFSGSLLFPSTPFTSYSAVFAKAVIDLRATSQLRSKTNNQPGRVFTPEDLKIGSIFMTVDNVARKVVNIYDHNGKTVIETIEPRPEEVFLSLYVPDFRVECDRSDIDLSSLAEGVTLLPPGADKKDMLSSDFTAPSEMDKSVTWLETDPATENQDIISFNIDIPLWSQDVSSEVLGSLQKKEDDAKKKNGITTETGGTPSLEVGASGEIRLVGTLRLATPVVTGGLKMPSMTVTWVHDWWIIYHPEFHFNSGYAKAGFEAAQQFDFKLTGTIKLEAEKKIPLYAIVVDTSFIELTLGFYAKISLEGEISITVAVSEFTRHNVGATCDLVWPFIPKKFSGYKSNYLNFAFRPTIAAEAELRVGLYLGGSFEIAGMSIIGAEAGGGAYILVRGFMEPMGIMGFDTQIGGYGNFNDWILDLYAEAGAYVEIGAEIFTIDIPIYDKTWPFWEWHKSWEI